MDTINVIKISNTVEMHIDCIDSFVNTIEGNNKARALFSRAVRHLMALALQSDMRYLMSDCDKELKPEDIDQEVIDVHLRNGYYRIGVWWIGIVRSNKKRVKPKPEWDQVGQLVY